MLSAAAAVGVGVTAWSTMRAGDTGPTPVIASSGSAVAQTPLANAPHPLVTAGDEQEQHADVDEEVGNVAEAAPSEERAAPSVHHPNTVSRHPSSRQPKPVGVAAEPAAGRVSAGAEAVRRTAPPTPPEQGASAPATALPRVTMGQDLSEIRKHNPRDIDEKNPFR